MSHESENERLSAMRRDLMTFGGRFPGKTTEGDAETARKIAALADQVLFDACCELTRVHALAVIARARSFIAMATGHSVAALQWVGKCRELEDQHEGMTALVEKLEAAAVEEFIGPRPPPEEMN